MAPSWAQVSLEGRANPRQRETEVVTESSMLLNVGMGEWWWGKDCEQPPHAETRGNGSFPRPSTACSCHHIGLNKGNQQQILGLWIQSKGIHILWRQEVLITYCSSNRKVTPVRDSERKSQAWILLWLLHISFFPYTQIATWNNELFLLGISETAYFTHQH